MSYIFESSNSIASNGGKPRKPTHVSNLMASTGSLTWSGSQMHIAAAEKEGPMVVVGDDGQEVSVPQVCACLLRLRRLCGTYVTHT